MSFSFEIALLGSKHNYVASLTKTLPSTYPLEASETTFFRKPQKFQDDFNKLAYSKHYLHKIRGHDFLSHTGQCTNRKVEITPVQQSAVIWAETSKLRKVAVLDAQKFSETPLEVIASFGPAPGSFFVDLPRLKLYQWANLPRTLEASLQTLICRHGYGDEKTKIQNVAVNSKGGWVLQGGKDHSVDWGGELPDELESVLQTLGKKKPYIKTLVMNHQHPTEYVLILDDGQIYCRLHSKFEQPLRLLLTKWAKGNKLILQWNYKSSCECTETAQQIRDALYYYRRGWFHLQLGTEASQRKSFELAYEYLKEAHTQDCWNATIRNAYARSLIALRPFRNDPILETHLVRGDRRQSVRDHVRHDRFVSGKKVRFPKSSERVVIGRGGGHQD